MSLSTSQTTASSSAADPKTWSPESLHQRLQAGDPSPLQLIDVREWAEFAGGRLPGAQCRPLDGLPGRLADLNRDVETVLVCRSGRRSAQALAQLGRCGFTQLGHLKGGLEAWKKANLPVEKDARAPWSLERQVRFAAGFLGVLGLAISLVWPPAVGLSWFVGLGLVFAAVTDTCAMGLLISKLPWNRPRS